MYILNANPKYKIFTQKILFSEVLSAPPAAIYIPKWDKGWFFYNINKC